MRKILTGIVISLLMISTGYCQEQKQLITLTIKSDKQVYETGEEIALSVAINNMSDKAVSLMHMDFSAWGQSSGLKFDIQDFRNEHPEYIHIEQRADMGYIPNIVILQPNEILEYRVQLEKWYKIDQPGLHKIKAEFVRNKEMMLRYKDRGVCYRSGEKINCSELSSCWDGIIASNPITIEVAEKNDSADYPASVEMSKAKSIAEEYLSKQSFKNAYSSKATAVNDTTKGYLEVYFSRRIPSLVKGDGLIRVDKETWDCKWIPSE